MGGGKIYIPRIRKRPRPPAFTLTISLIKLSLTIAGLILVIFAILRCMTGSFVLTPCSQVSKLLLKFEISRVESLFLTKGFLSSQSKIIPLQNKQPVSP